MNAFGSAESSQPAHQLNIIAALCVLNIVIINFTCKNQTQNIHTFARNLAAAAFFPPLTWAALRRLMAVSVFEVATTAGILLLFEGRTQNSQILLLMPQDTMQTEILNQAHRQHQSAEEPHKCAHHQRLARHPVQALNFIAMRRNPSHSLPF